MRVWRNSLRGRLAGSFLLLSIMMVGLVSYASYMLARDALKQSFFERLSAIAALKKQNLNDWIEDAQQEVRFFAQGPALRQYAPAVVGQSSSAERQEAYTVLSDYLKSAVTIMPEFEEIFLLSDVGGQILVSSRPEHEGQYRVHDTYFIEGRRGLYVQNVYPSPITGKPAMTIAAPVVDDQGRRLGVLAAHLNLTWMDNVLLDTRGLGRTGETYVVDKVNNFVSSDRFGRQSFPRGVHTVGIDAAVRGEDGAGLYLNYAGKPVIGVYTWIADRNLALLAEVEQQEAFAPARRLAILTVLIGTGSVAVLILGVLLISYRLSRPLQALTTVAQKVADGDWSEPVPVETDDEVGLLSRTFNRMTAQIQQYYQSLQQSEHHFRSLIENASDVIATLSRDGVITYISPSVTGVLGYRPDEVIGLSVTSVMHPSDVQMVNQVLAQHKGDEALPIEVRVRHKDGSWRILETSRSRIVRDGTMLQIVNARDITERRRLEEQVLHLQRLETVGTLAGGVAHDFNNMLNIIIGYAQLAQLDVDDDHPVASNLTEIVGVAQRAAGLTRQLLAFSRRQVFELKVVNLNSVVQTTAEMVRRIIGERIHLQVVLDENLPNVRIDVSQIEQVLINLCVNGRDAMPNGGVLRIETDTTYLDEEFCLANLDAVPGSYVRLRVSDNGIGMSKEVQRRIFEPFFTTKGVGQGTGLGLAVVHGIIHQHGGLIDVESEEDRGTTFTVYLPVSRRASSVQRQDAPKVYGGQETILLAEDETALRQMAAGMLTRLGYTVLVAADGEEAVRLFSEHANRVDLVLLDVVMPHCDGQTAFERMRRQVPDLPALFATGYGAHAFHIKHSAEAGISVIQKPYSLDLIAQRVREMLDGRGKEGSGDAAALSPNG